MIIQGDPLEFSGITDNVGIRYPLCIGYGSKSTMAELINCYIKATPRVSSVPYSDGLGPLEYYEVELFDVDRTPLPMLGSDGSMRVMSGHQIKFQIGNGHSACIMVSAVSSQSDKSNFIAGFSLSQDKTDWGASVSRHDKTPSEIISGKEYGAIISRGIEDRTRNLGDTPFNGVTKVFGCKTFGTELKALARRSCLTVICYDTVMNLGGFRDVAPYGVKNDHELVLDHWEDNSDSITVSEKRTPATIHLISPTKLICSGDWFVSEGSGYMFQNGFYDRDYRAAINGNLGLRILGNPDKASVVRIGGSTILDGAIINNCEVRVDAIGTTKAIVGSVISNTWSGIRIGKFSHHIYPAMSETGLNEHLIMAQNVIMNVEEGIVDDLDKTEKPASDANSQLDSINDVSKRVDMTGEMESIFTFEGNTVYNGKYAIRLRENRDKKRKVEIFANIFARQTKDDVKLSLKPGSVVCAQNISSNLGITKLNGHCNIGNANLEFADEINGDLSPTYADYYQNEMPQKARSKYVGKWFGDIERGHAFAGVSNVELG